MNKGKIKTVSIQGIKGAFHEIAARAYFKNKEMSIVECDTFKDVVNTVKSGIAEFGIIAIENSIAGSILPNYKIIQESKLNITGEIFIPIQQNLMALPGQIIEDLTEVYSHPMAIQQCEEFFEQHPDLKIIESIDTALSAKKIKDEGIIGRGAIASKLAASIYGLEIIAESIETNKRNYTRFLIVEERQAFKTAHVSDKIDKSSICFSLTHEFGSLSKVLSVLAFYNLNLTKIQSMPILGREWEYLFHIDLVFDNYKRYTQALNAIEPLTNNIEILGEYHSYEKAKEIFSNKD
jgi:prephenate dehydratase